MLSAAGVVRVLLLVFLGGMGTEAVLGQFSQAAAQVLPVRPVRGQALYEKVPVDSHGLDPARSWRAPIRDAEVQVFSRLTGEVVFTARTDSDGSFSVEVPVEGDYGLRALSRSASSNVVVADNTNRDAIYAIESDVPEEGDATLLALDSDRGSGAFNILEILRQANAFLHEVEPGIQAPDLTVYWSPRNHGVFGNPLEGEIGSTFFSEPTGTAFVLGDRASDSDEFDDAVLLHEYAHMLAQRFSRDDSIGGAHVPGDVLDPRVAWSEGWANFFSGLIRNDPIYRDSFDPGGTSILEYDLEDNMLTDPAAGYWSESAIHRILWDLFDSQTDPGDDLALEPALIWQAFRGLSRTSFVYLPDFLDQLSRLVPSQVSAIEQTAWSHFIDYVHSANLAVLNPFPKLASTGVVTGEIDSWLTGRANLAKSAHLYAFDTAGGAVSIRLDITGLGPAGNQAANDLDLFLMNADGRVVARSDRGLDGEAEQILAFLPAGTYVVEIRSFYRREGARQLTFNSGAYRLAISGP